jgi:hypothetical protein
VGAIGAIIVVIVVLVAGLVSFVKNVTKDIPGVSSITSGFAVKGLTFGSKGIGQGMFTDARSVAVDNRNGNIVVGDFQDGRVQTFDASGKYLSTFMVEKGDGVDALLVDSAGQIYVAYNSHVLIYNDQGQQVKVLEDTQGVRAMAFGSDESLYIITSDDQVKHFNTQGKLLLTIDNAFRSVLGSADMTPHIAVDGVGNIYLIGEHDCTVVKYSPEGDYLDKFGGQADSDGPYVPGTTFNASGIGVDGYGRVFVSDWNTDVQVFGTDGHFIQSVDALTLGVDALIYGMTIDRQNVLYLALGDRIMELKIQQP